MNSPYLILGPCSQIARDVLAVFDAASQPYVACTRRLKTSSQVKGLLSRYPDHQVINFAFDRTLNDQFTNIGLPGLLDTEAALPPVFLSSNAVYGIRERHVGSHDSLDAFNRYAAQKITTEALLTRSAILRGSFLARGHQIFVSHNTRIHPQALWNGITAFELARLLMDHRFKAGIVTLASQTIVTWPQIAERFNRPTIEDNSLIENRCTLISDLCTIAPLEQQFETLAQALS